MYFVIQKKIVFQIFITSLSIMLARNALAETLEDDFTGEVPIILSATRLAQPQSEAPVATTIIDRKIIEAMGVVEIAEIFRMVPGFQVAFSDGTIPVVTYHGMSDEYARRMQILIDGRSVYTPMFGGPEWADLPLAIEDIERVEIIRGPNAVTFGANSFQAVINIITRNSAEEYGNTLKIRKGSKDDNHAFYRYGFKHENIDTRISFRHQQDHGLKRDTTNPLGKFIGDSKLVNIFTLRSEMQLDTKNFLEVHLGTTDSNMEKGVNDNDIRVFHKKFTQRHYQMLVWRNIQSYDNETTIRFFHNYNKVDDKWLTNDLGGGLRAYISESASDRRLDLEVQQIARLGEYNRLALGSSIREDSVHSPAFFDDDGILRNYIYRLFANNETRIGNLLINAGAMLENNSITDTDISPRLALNYHINNNHTIRASISKAYRNPVLIEEFGDQRIHSTDGSVTDVSLWTSGGLKPESIISREIGYIFQNLQKGIYLDAKVFKNSVRSLVTFIDRTPPAEDNYAANAFAEDLINLNWAEIEGFETQFKYSPNRNNSLTVNYAYANIKSSDLNLDWNNYLSQSIPKHSFSILATRKLPNNFSASIAYYNVGQMTWLGSGGLIPKYNRTDFRVARNFKRGEIETEFVLQNVFNKKYYDFENESVNERRLFANLTIHF